MMLLFKMLPRFLIIVAERNFRLAQLTKKTGVVYDVVFLDPLEVFEDGIIGFLGKIVF